MLERTLFRSGRLCTAASELPETCVGRRQVAPAGNIVGARLPNSRIASFLVRRRRGMLGMLVAEGTADDPEGKERANSATR
jgi:hypothetical protein